MKIAIPNSWNTQYLSRKEKTRKNGSSKSTGGNNYGTGIKKKMTPEDCLGRHR